MGHPGTQAGETSSGSSGRDMKRAVTPASQAPDSSRWAGGSRPISNGGAGWEGTSPVAQAGWGATVAAGAATPVPRQAEY